MIPSAPTDPHTASLLDLIASDERKAGDYERFLAACWQDHQTHGSVSCNRVRAALTNNYGLTVHPRLYSSFWSKATAKGGPMVTTTEWEISTDTRGKNSGKPQRLRRWVGSRP